MRANNLKVERVKLDLTQAQLAEKLGVRADRYRMWENGITQMPVKYMKVFFDLTGAKFEDVF